MKHINFILLSLFVVISFSCDKDEEDLILIEETMKILNYGDEYQIEAISTSEITYLSENEYHATVTEEGLVTAMCVGETNIVLSNDEDTKTLKIIVEPEYDLFPEPNVDFGTSKANLVEKYGIPTMETESGIGYDNYSPKAPIVMYIFDENDNLKASMVLVKIAYSSELASYLVERYLPVSVEDDMIMLMNGLTLDSASMIIGATLDDLMYWQIIYIPSSQ